MSESKAHRRVMGRYLRKRYEREDVSSIKYTNGWVTVEIDKFSNGETQRETVIVGSEEHVFRLAYAAGF